MATSKEPRVKIAGQWVPTHRIWKMLETVNTATDLVERYNQENPEHASSLTNDTVNNVRERLGALQMTLTKPADEEEPDLATISNELLQSMPLDDVITELAQSHGTEIDAKGLIALIGEEAYIESMQREVKEYLANMITPDQIAELWNEIRRPPPAGGIWTENLVKKTFDL